MGDPAGFVSQTLTAFKTALTDYSAHHDDNTGPYADNLDLDAIVVGAGFSKSHRRPRALRACHRPLT